MSVVLVTDCYDTIRPVIECLRAQTARSELEIVLVAPSRQALALDGTDFAEFAEVRVVETGWPLVLEEGRAAGVRAATSPIVFIGETHAYPHARWAETLIAAHAGPWALVVPGFGNANPQGALSWAGFIADYGPWVDSLPPGEIDYAPIYNAAYRRSALLEFGDDLDHLVGYGDEVLVGLRARGHRIYFEPAARIDHVNLARPGAWLRERYLAGLLIAATRARRWSRARRLFYVCASPLIPAVCLSRVRKGVVALVRERSVPAAAFPALLLGAIVKAVGEMVGYARGAAGASANSSMTSYELHKLSYVSRGAPRAERGAR